MKAGYTEEIRIDGMLIILNKVRPKLDKENARILLAEANDLPYFSERGEFYVDKDDFNIVKYRWEEQT